MDAGVVKSQLVKSISEEVRTRPDLLDKIYLAMGEKLLEFIKVAYLQKSRGMSDQAGEAWKPTKAFIRKGGWMLFETGKLFESLRVETTENGFRIVFDLDYGIIQFKERSPVPTRIPEQWKAAMIEAAKPYIEDIIVSGIKKIQSSNMISIDIRR